MHVTIIVIVMPSIFTQYYIQYMYVAYYIMMRACIFRIDNNARLQSSRNQVSKRSTAPADYHHRLATPVLHRTTTLTRVSANPLRKPKPKRNPCPLTLNI